MLDAKPDSAAAFHSVILRYALEALKFSHLTDNFDAQRYNIDGTDHSGDFDSALRARYVDWFVRAHERCFAAYRCLDDETSRSLFLNLIAYRLGGHLSVRIPVTYPRSAEDLARYTAIEKSSPSSLAADGPWRKLRHYDFEHEGRRYVVDCLGLEYYLLRRQYFFSRDGVVIAPQAGDAVIDGGAWVGDTAQVFSNAVGPAGLVYACDPVGDHLEVLARNIAQFPIRNVRAMPFGLSDRDVDLPPPILNRFAPGFQSQRFEVPLRRIDGLVDKGEIARIDFLKLDVEGSELPALRGAHQSIARFRPRMAISLYHQPNDLFAIILHIRQHFPFYRMHIDHYSIHREETVLYCQCPT